MITAITVAGRVRAWLDRYRDQAVPRWLVEELLAAVERDRQHASTGGERLGLAEGRLTVAQIAARSGEEPEQVITRIYGGPPR